MDLSPPALTRSPSSPPNTYCPSETSLDYPSPVPLYKISCVYGGDPPCCIAPASLDGDTSLPFNHMSQPDWNGTTMMHPPSSAASVPSLMSAEYGAFGGYELKPPYGHHVYHAHTSHPQAPVSSPATPVIGRPSRSPAARAASKTPLSCHGSPGVKMETASDYGYPLEVSHYPSPRSVHSTYTSATRGCMSDGAASSRHKAEYRPVEPDHAYDEPAAARQNTGFIADARRQCHVAPHRRVPRRFTTREEANFQCKVKGCGKLFSRSYNFKAHMDTHDEKREYPFPCPVPGCSKKFVRKTDLQRHHQSVHLKERCHKCDRCDRKFARKDTLRRHMEDGCSKRFDITQHIRADAYASINLSARSMGGPLSHLVPTPAALPPMAVPPLGSGNLFTSLPPVTRGRDTIAAEDSQPQPWGR